MRGCGVWVPAFAGTTVNLFSFLCLVPECVHFRKRAARERTALLLQGAFDVAKSPLELGVGAAQRHIGIGADVTRQVDHGEQQIAGFGCKLISVMLIERCFGSNEFTWSRCSSAWS